MASLIAACASGPVATVEDRAIQPETMGQNTAEQAYGGSQGDTATPLEGRRYQIEQAEYYRRLADSSQASTETIDATLSAAEFYIQADDPRRAERSIADLTPAQLTPMQDNRYQVILAYLAYAQMDYDLALDRIYAMFSRMQSRQQATLANEQQPEFSQANTVNQQRVDALLLASFCHQALGEYDLAITNLVERESLLFGAARAETTRYIWQVINSLDVAQRQAVIDSTSNAVVRNRFEQSLQGEVGTSAQQPRQFDQWRRSLPENQADLMESRWGPSAPRNIAILLPLSSRFNKAAQAVRDGIEYQHSLNQSNYRPQINVYDVGDSPWQIMQFYAAAQQSGADLIIGPLGKDYANQLTSSNQAGAAIPTVLLGGDQFLPRHAARLTISPEHQGRLVSERAMASGYVNAAILVPNTTTGTRTADAFTRHWLQNGGKLSKAVSYSPRQFDHSTELKQLFDINQSEFRHRRISDVLGFKPKFAAYRRTDIDFIFMIADNKSGRIVRPQINFFSGATVPVLAPSSIYNGIPDETNNVDLDDTSFPVMPWVLMSNEVSPYAGQLNMLFAMGSDAYQLAANFREMRSNQNLALQGNMGILSIEPNGEVINQPVWAKFRDGMAESEQTLTPINRPQPRPDPGVRYEAEERQQGQRSYNESNWDSRQSRRKIGS
ncbi:MAG: penicillin-binding protein activator [Pseudomonadota bacterium]